MKPGASDPVKEVIRNTGFNNFSEMISNSIRLLSVCMVLLVFLFSNFGPVVIFEILQTKNTTHINRLLASADNSKLLRLEISWDDLNNKEFFNYENEELENEIRYKGHIFNFAKEESTRDGKIFYCLNDPYEELLVVKLNDSEMASFDQLPANAPVNPFSKKINYYFGIKYFSPENSVIDLISYIGHIMPDYKSVSLEVPTLPPLQA